MARPRRVRAAFAQSVLDDLFHAVETDDVVDPIVSLPDVIPTGCTSDEMRRCLDLSIAFWRQGAGRAELVALVDRLIIRGDLPPTARTRYKLARARYKQLRFALVLLGEAHRAPRLFAATVAVMGQLQDAFRNCRRWATTGYGLLLRLLLCRPLWMMVRREVDAVAVDDDTGLLAFQQAELRRLKAWLRADAVSGHVFHAIRKVISRQVAFHDMMRTLRPTSERRQLSRFLSAINGLMGRQHDDLVVKANARQLDYHHDAFPLPDDIRRRLELLTARYPPED